MFTFWNDIKKYKFCDEEKRQDEYEQMHIHALRYVWKTDMKQ